MELQVDVGCVDLALVFSGVGGIRGWGVGPGWAEVQGNFSEGLVSCRRFHAPTLGGRSHSMGGGWVGRTPKVRRRWHLLASLAVRGAGCADRAKPRSTNWVLARVHGRKAASSALRLRSDQAALQRGGDPAALAALRS